MAPLHRALGHLHAGHLARAGREREGQQGVDPDGSRNTERSRESRRPSRSAWHPARGRAGRSCRLGRRPWPAGRSSLRSARCGASRRAARPRTGCRPPRCRRPRTGLRPRRPCCGWRRRWRGPSPECRDRPGKRGFRRAPSSRSRRRGSAARRRRGHVWRSGCAPWRTRDRGACADPYPRTTRAGPEARPVMFRTPTVLSGSLARECGTAYAGVETRTSDRSWRTSAIWTALVAAPLSRLSLTTHSCRPRSCVGSRRRRPTKTSSRPALSSAVG